ncbi:MAG: HAMP domain-containing sensor histidine kinase [Flavipsychrobacter sp.]
MRYFTTVHLLLLAYIISAILFWGFSLQQQSTRIYELEKSILTAEIDSNVNKALYDNKVAALEETKSSRTKQYWGEGSTFLIIILIGAAVVYSSFRRSMRLSRQQNNFILAVTHELKSPIAGIKLNLQTLERHELPSDKKKMLIERSVFEANRLNDLCNNMLMVSRIEGRQYKAAKDNFNLSELVADSLHDYADRYPDRFKLSNYDDKYVTGDRTLIQMAINNLLENAIKYSPAGTEIECVLSTKNNYAVIEVKDLGIGIHEDEKNKVFNKFYRVGREETRKTKGTGLGLYLTSKIVKQHKGKIAVKDNEPQGSIFEICLPMTT